MAFFVFFGKVMKIRLPFLMISVVMVFVSVVALIAWVVNGRLSVISCSFGMQSSLHSSQEYEAFI